jgi:imidazolonepropionase-like amidohydrolase
MKRALIFLGTVLGIALATLLTACTPPQESGVKVIVGAKLITAPGAAPIEYSVVVIEGGKFREVGPQSSTPVPKGAEMTRGLGMMVEPTPGGGPIEVGKPADLILKDEKPSTERVMRNGEWVR